MFEHIKDDVGRGAELWLPKDQLGADRILLPKKSKGLGVWCKFGISTLDEKGRILSHREGPSRSFVRNAGLIIRNILLVVSPVNEDLVDDTGVARKGRFISGLITSGAEPTVGAAGIMKFGSGVTPVASTDFNITTPIPALANATVTTAIITESASQDQWTHTGQSTNSSGITVTVQEVGLFAQLNDAFAAATLRTIMMLHDLSGAVPVANGITVQGVYTITVAV
jgi:hypothetical protein